MSDELGRYVANTNYTEKEIYYIPINSFATLSDAALISLCKEFPCESIVITAWESSTSIIHSASGIPNFSKFIV